MSLIARTKKERSALIANNPINIVDLLIFMVAAIVYINLYVSFMDDPEYPNISNDAFQLFIKGMFGLLLYLGGTILFNTRKNRFIGVVGLGFEGSRDIILIGGAIISYMLIQVLGNFLLELKAFQIAAREIYAFYIGGAEMEEMLWRAGLITFMQGALVWTIFIPQRGKKLNLSEKDLLLINAVVVVFSAYLFMADHDLYQGNPTAQIVTFLGGVSQGIFFIASKKLLGPSLAHFIINGMYAGSLIQSLRGSPT